LVLGKELTWEAEPVSWPQCQKGAPRNLKNSFFVTQNSRIAVDRIRADGSGDIQLGSLSTKLNQTHFQGPAPRPLPGPGAAGASASAPRLESRPFRPACTMATSQRQGPAPHFAPRSGA
jgi:hypothetical protein